MRYKIQHHPTHLIEYYLFKSHLDDETSIKNEEEVTEKDELQSTKEDETSIENKENVNVKDSLESTETLEFSKTVILDGIGNLYYEKKNINEMLTTNSLLSWDEISFPMNLLKRSKEGIHHIDHPLHIGQELIEYNIKENIVTFVLHQGDIHHGHYVYVVIYKKDKKIVIVETAEE